ncbi:MULTISPECIES: hypothetical protein [Sphingobacterium]|uniref:Uncharacterized protein n=1 Tax=Sphingobacterium athyrii TaxID=2152717 RepID=A0A363NXP3_9SPHI|nr:MULTISPECIES: hypothetical protein [Sphingobacterium]PUV25507.1 hypothetical protein DCO56_00485 [Sphingobacterium athyrii]
MRTTIHFRSGMPLKFEDAFLLLNEIDPIGNNPGTDKGIPVRRPPRVPDLEEVTPDKYYPENAEGPDPTEEEQRDRDDLDHIDPDHEKHPEKPDHKEEDIYPPDSDQEEDVEEKGL